MVYQLKKDNYKSFNIFKDNVLEPRAYFIPFASKQELDETDIRTERYNSSMVSVLSGEWDFKYYSKRSEMPEEFDTQKEQTDIISVPSCWQFTGYEKPYYVNSRYQFKCNPPVFPEDCPVGVYIKRFSLDELCGNYILTFLGVSSCYDVFLNGKYVGYSEGSHNTSEFEITEFLQAGENELVVAVHKWCTGTYLECQDMFRNNGIFRDVLITRTTDNSVYDFEVKTTYNSDGTYILDIIPSFKITDEVTFTAELVDGEEVVASKSINVCPGKVDKLTFDVLDVEKWSAEIPKLYKLYLSLSKEGRIIEIIRRNIGFKHIEIRKNVFFFNNEKIKLLGVNHHDSNPKTGYCMTVEDMEKDVSIFKEFNVNCVRTSHYPPDPIFLDLCDEYGVYVVDEADIECHGVTEKNDYNLIAKNLEWKEHFWDRVYRMYQRDKNHPSITMWSLGNESGGYKCHDYCYNSLKPLTAIPIHYEGVCRTKRWAYDVHSEMYTWPNVCRMIANGKGMPLKYYKKPFYLCEYAHAMGVGAGELEEYVKLFYSSDIMMGGCIWEFSDHAAYHENSEYEYTYGGDHGEWRHDGNFCVDGLFFPNREPHTGAYQMKACYRPVRASLAESNEFEFKNYLYFKNASFKVKYSVLTNGYETSCEELELNIKPQETQKIHIDYNAEKHTSIVFYYYDGENPFAREQIILNDKYAPELSRAAESDMLSCKESESRVIVEFKNGSLMFNLKTGELESYKYASKELVNQSPLSERRGFLPDLYRAPFDNDMYLKNSWHKMGLNHLVTAFNKAEYKNNGSNVVITASYKLKTPMKNRAGEFKTTYSVNPMGEINFSYEINNIPFKFIPKLGILLEMPKCFSNIKYFGYDMETLSDFHEHSVIKVNELKVCDMHEKYIKPQESGMRYNTYWAEITDASSMGLRFESEAPFTFNANHFSAQQCAKATHKEDLSEYETTVVHIDGFEMGAGSNSCGPTPTAKHKRANVCHYKGSFKIKPIGD